MKRILCLLLVLVMMCSLCVQASADGDVLYCRMCGKKIPADSRVCSYCGETVVHVDEDAAVKTLGSESSVTQTPAAPSAAPAPAAPSVASPAASTDVKTALSQSSAPSPATQASTAVPGPFNTTLGTSGSPGHVRVTKSPTSESVPYGGSCSFIAHAANATSVTWYIANSDASIICAAYDAPSSVSGLYVSGANSDTLYLSGIPSWWNGCQVQACFTGEGGPVYTESARIWTYQPAVQQSCSNWGFWDWFNYCYWGDPYYGCPGWIPLDPWDDAPNPPDVSRSITLPSGASIAPEMSDRAASRVPEATVVHIGHDGPSGSWGVNPDDSDSSVTVIHTGHDGPSGSWGVNSNDPTSTSDDTNPPPPPPPTGGGSGGPGPAPAGFNPGSTD